LGIAAVIPCRARSLSFPRRRRDERHGAGDHNAGKDRKPRIVANIVVDGDRDLAESQRLLSSSCLESVRVASAMA